VKVLNLDRRRAGGDIDVHTVVRDDARPEQAVLRDARVEVVNLRAPRTGGLVDVDSRKDERRVPNVTVPSLEDALHESHVVERERERSRLTGPAIRPLAFPADEGDAGGAPEVEDTGRVGIHSSEWRRLHVEFLATDVERRGNRRDETEAQWSGDRTVEPSGRAECDGDAGQTRGALKELAA
jgi:hypothetical protein